MRANAALGGRRAHTSHSVHTPNLPVSLPEVIGFSQYSSSQTTIKPGQYIYEQGSPAAQVFFIDEGLASLVHYDQNLRLHSDPNSKLSMVVGFASAGNFMGLPEFFKGHKRESINYKTSSCCRSAIKGDSF